MYFIELQKVKTQVLASGNAILALPGRSVYEVIPAGSIEEVFSKFKRAKPDMLVLEVRQQDVKEETLEKLKEHYPEIPWIGHSTLIQCPDEFKKWVNFYLSKSPNMDGIKELIRGVQGGEKNHAAHC